MKKKFLFGFSVICVSAAFWACGDDSTVSGLLEDLCEGDESCAAAMSSAAGALSSAAAASSAAATSSAAALSSSAVALSSSAVALSSSAVVSSSSVAGSSSSVGTSSSSEASSSSVAPEPEPEPVGDYDLNDVTCYVGLFGHSEETDVQESYAPGVSLHFLVKNNVVDAETPAVAVFVDGSKVGVAKTLSSYSGKTDFSLDGMTAGEHTVNVMYNNASVCEQKVKIEPPKITATGCKLDEHTWDNTHYFVPAGFSKEWNAQVLGTTLDMTLKLPNGQTQVVNVSVNYNAGFSIDAPVDGQTFELIYEGNTVCTVVAGQEPATPDNGDNTGDNGDNTGDNGDNTGDNGDDTGSEGGESGSEGEGGEGGEGNSEGGEA